MTANSRKLWRTTSSMNNRLVLIVISNPGFVLKVSSVWERSRYMYIWNTACWTPDHDCTFTFGDSTMWLKKGIIQHSIKIMQTHATMYYQLQVLYTLFLGQVYQGQVTAADWLLGINTTIIHIIICRLAMLCDNYFLCHTTRQVVPLMMPTQYNTNFACGNVRISTVSCANTTI